MVGRDGDIAGGHCFSLREEAQRDAASGVDSTYDEGGRLIELALERVAACGRPSRRVGPRQSFENDSFPAVGSQPRQHFR